MSTVEKVLYIAMLVIIIGIFLVIIIFGLTGSGKEKITKRLLTAKGDEDRKRRGYRFAKRFFDVITSLFGIVFFGPLTLIVAIMLKCTGTKPILVRYNCVGRGGQKAHYSRFNTISRESRVIRAIWSMRLDALPMYAAVLLGNITLLGISLLRYDKASSERKQLYKYEKPGLVSIGSLFRIEGKTEEDVDRMYLKTRSILLDASILFYLIRQILITPTE